MQPEKQDFPNLIALMLILSFLIFVAVVVRTKNDHDGPLKPTSEQYVPLGMDAP